MIDDMPPPAYRPQPAAQPQPAPRSFAAHDEDAAAFVAPRPRPAGQPSPEALARLQAAVTKNPATAQRPQPTAQRPAAAAPAAPARAPEKSRFGIGSLINRMAGHATETERPAPRQQPQVTSFDDEQELSADQERIEIPAFLRRQAN